MTVLIGIFRFQQLDHNKDGFQYERDLKKG